MSAFTHQDWIRHLRQIAAPAADPAAPLHLGPLEPALRAALVGGEPPPAADPRATGEIRLWSAAAGAAIDVDVIVTRASAGPLLERDAFLAIEVWTDAELSALHALHRLARERRRRDWAARLDAARTWHIENTQPDNATNRPWAVHVFLLAGGPESALYAQTLLHNATAMSGRPDALAAWLLLDAAREIELATG